MNQTTATTHAVGHEQRGAVLIVVVVAMVALLAFSAFVIDYGVMLTARNQVQTAADAGALSGAITLAYESSTDFNNAQVKARAAARANMVWGQAADVQLTDVMLVPPSVCKPPSYPVGIPDTCVKVDAFRTVQRGNGLPIYFGNLVGISDQGVRATATARVVGANGTSCLKPWMIADKWEDNTAPATKFNGADRYAPPDPITGLGGTGYTLLDRGTVVVFHPGNPRDAIAPGNYYDVDLDGTGGNNLRHDIGFCSGRQVGIGDSLRSFPGKHVGPTEQGLDDLMKRDPNAIWNGTDVVNGCCFPSPRIVPIAMFNPADYAAQDRHSGRFELTVVNIMGFFVIGFDKKTDDLTGVLISLPGELLTGTTVGPASAFLNKIILVR